jgi:Helix-turn-helix domain
MSIRVINAVWKHSRQKKSGALVVLLAIADYTNDDGFAFPAISTLARKARMSKRNAQRWVRVLEQDGELNVLRNQGRGGVNLYKICLPSGNPKNGDAHVTSDTCGTKSVTHTSSDSDADAIQSVNESSIETSPIVPKGDDADFWIEICFRCFKQAVRPLQTYISRRLLASVPGLKRSHADSLVKFYRAKSLDSEEPPYSSRRHSPERLMIDLPRQLALAVQAWPPPKKYDFTIEDVIRYLKEKYGDDCSFPRSLEELDGPWYRYLRDEVYDAMRGRKGKRIE